MAPKKPKPELEASSDDVRSDLPPGVKLLRTLEGQQSGIHCLAFDPQGRTLASASLNQVILWETSSGRQIQTLAAARQVFSLAFDPRGRAVAGACIDKLVKLWDTQTGKLLRTFEGHQEWPWSVAFNVQNGRLASGARDSTVRLWELQSGNPLRTLEGHERSVTCVAFDRQNGTLASASDDNTVKLWHPQTGQLLHTLTGHQSTVWSVAFHPHNGTLASASADSTVKLWEAQSGKLLRTLEAHTKSVDIVVFSPDGKVMVSKSQDQSVRLWSCLTWETVAVIPESIDPNNWLPNIAIHPTLPVLATVGWPSDVSDSTTWTSDPPNLVHLWELDYSSLFGADAVAPTKFGVHHTTGKVVLLGDHSVGKSALGHRLIHNEFKEQASTHGQQFWVFPALGKSRDDGTACEAILWDFAGQPDYRLVHALFIDNADLALLLFDASDLRDPLRGVGFWLKQLQRGQTRCPIILVAAQTDRGSSSLSPEELTTFCQKHGIVGPVAISAATGFGLEELVEEMKSLIPWDEKPPIVTTTTFKRIKDYVLNLKEKKQDQQMIVTAEELRTRLEATDADWKFTDAEMLTAVGHLENYGYVKRLRTSKGEPRVLLQPERLNNLASSFVLEARRNPKGLGALEEKRLLAGAYNFPELKDLIDADREVLLDSAALLFLEHNVCFRETDPLRIEPYLVFPELINLKQLPEEEAATQDGAAYTVSGQTENVFASLVVLLGYTHTFTRTKQWQNNARYEVGDGLVCGFRQEAERDGELDFVLCFGPNVGRAVRTLFQSLFESFLEQRNLIVVRFEPVRCDNADCGRLLDRSVVRQRLKEGKAFAFCNECGAKLLLAKPIELTRKVKREVQSERRAAEQRTHFEQAVFRVCAYIAEEKIAPLECFISYAWGEPEHERWVEKRLAKDLQKAGLTVLLDRWDNVQIGSSVPRFVERVRKSDRVIVVGTPLYRKKYENGDPMRGYVVAAEGDLIGTRLIGTEANKRSVLPLVLAGTDDTALPDLLLGRVYADFRDESTYFTTAFDLILSIYQIPPNHAAVADLRDSLRGTEIR